VVRLFFRPHGHLRLKLAVEQANRVHPQFPACADFAHWPVADNKNLAGNESRPFLDLAERRFFGKDIASVGKINFFDRGFAIESQSFYFCMLGLGFAKADNEISDSTFG